MAKTPIGPTKSTDLSTGLVENPDPGGQRVLRVAVPAPVDRLFDYLGPDSGPAPGPGSRVIVPFGRQQRTGIVMETAERSDIESDRLKRLTDVPDDSPVFDRDMLSLLRWSADYYQHPIGEVVLNAVPVALRKRAAWPGPEDGWQLRPGADLQALGRAPQQARAAGLIGETGIAGAETLSSLGTGWRRWVNALVEKGVAEKVPMPVAPTPALARPG